MEKRYATLQELSQYLGIPKRTLYHWIAIRKIPFYKPGRGVLFDLKEIDTWMTSQRVGPYEGYH
jgi:excisionase family DNA binding protein